MLLAHYSMDFLLFMPNPVRRAILANPLKNALAYCLKCAFIVLFYINSVMAAEIELSKSEFKLQPEISRSSASEDDLLAFPNATGYGRFASGGRGGQVVIVDTLKDVVDEHDSQVSIREAFEVIKGPRTITFAVGGVFDMGISQLVLNGEQGSDVTIACQTAPAPGVVIKGAGLRITNGARNIIMRHCRIRNVDPGSPVSEASRAIGVIGTTRPVHNMIFDHMSLSWATDENFTVFSGSSANSHSTNFTLSNSIIAEGDADSSHPESGQLPGRYMHSMGPSCNSNSKKYRINGCSILSNLIAHNARRNPLLVASSGEVLNNVIYNWHEIGTHAWPWHNELDIVVKNNEFKTGPSTRVNKPVLQISGDPNTTRYVQESNWLNLHTEPGVRKIEDYWQGVTTIKPSYSEAVSYTH